MVVPPDNARYALTNTSCVRSYACSRLPTSRKTKLVSGVWKRVKMSSKSSIPTTGPEVACASARDSASAPGSTSASSSTGDSGAATAGVGASGSATTFRARVARVPPPFRAARRFGPPGGFGLYRRTGGSISYTCRTPRLTRRGWGWFEGDINGLPFHDTRWLVCQFLAHQDQDLEPAP